MNPCTTTLCDRPKEFSSKNGQVDEWLILGALIKNNSKNYYGSHHHPQQNSSSRIRKGSWLELPNELSVAVITMRIIWWRPMQTGLDWTSAAAVLLLARDDDDDAILVRGGAVLLLQQKSPFRWWWPKDSVCGWSWNGVNYNNKITRKILQFKSQSHLHPCSSASTRALRGEGDLQQIAYHVFSHAIEPVPHSLNSQVFSVLLLFSNTLIMPDLNTRTRPLCRLCVLVQILPLMMLQYNTQVDLDLYLFSLSLSGTGVLVVFLWWSHYVLILVTDPFDSSSVRLLLHLRRTLKKLIVLLYLFPCGLLVRI